MGIAIMRGKRDVSVVVSKKNCGKSFSKATAGSSALARVGFKATEPISLPHRHKAGPHCSHLRKTVNFRSDAARFTFPGGFAGSRTRSTIEPSLRFSAPVRHNKAGSAELINASNIRMTCASAEANTWRSTINSAGTEVLHQAHQQW
jgi:hypothetical protein